MFDFVAYSLISIDSLTYKQPGFSGNDVSFLLEKNHSVSRLWLFSITITKAVARPHNLCFICSR